MTSPQHTPGPWYSVEPKFYGSLGTVTDIKSENGTEVGTVWGGQDDEPKANAALISAAPELLQTLKDLVFGVELHEQNNGHAVAYLAGAKAAIAKAEGRA